MQENFFINSFIFETASYCYNATEYNQLTRYLFIHWKYNLNFTCMFSIPLVQPNHRRQKSKDMLLLKTLTILFELSSYFENSACCKCYSLCFLIWWIRVLFHACWIFFLQILYCTYIFCLFGAMYFKWYFHYFLFRNSISLKLSPFFGVLFSHFISSIVNGFCYFAA